MTSEVILQGNVLVAEFILAQSINIQGVVYNDTELRALASEANATASEASAIASEAANTATEALNSVASATNAANNATQAAQTATANADNALDIAADATQYAASANQTAGNASTAASNAQQTANNALSGLDNKVDKNTGKLTFDGVNVALNFPENVYNTYKLSAAITINVTGAEINKGAVLMLQGDGNALHIPTFANATQEGDDTFDTTDNAVNPIILWFRGDKIIYCIMSSYILDAIAMTLGSQSFTSVAQQTANWVFTPNKIGSIYYMRKLATDAAPTKADILASGTHHTISTATQQTVALSGMTHSTAYIVYYYTINGSGVESTVQVSSQLTTSDLAQMTAPVITVGAVSQSVLSVAVNANVNGVDIYVSNTSNGTYLLYESLTAGNLNCSNLTGLTHDTTRYFKAIAKGNGTTTSDSNLSTAYSGTTSSLVQLSAPTNVIATSNGQTEIDLSWTDAANESSYQIEVSDNGTTGWTVLINKAANSTSHAHTGLTINTTKYYRITSIGDNAIYSDSAYSSIVHATTNGLIQLSTPGSFVATANGQNEIDLSWTDVAHEINYNIEVSDNSSTGWTTLAIKAANSINHIHNSLSAGTTKYYRIQSLGDGVTYSDSAYSGVVNATTSGLTQLSTPGSFAATANGQNEIDLSWTDILNESNYQLEVSDNGSTGWSVLATKAANSTSHAHTGLAAATLKYYRIKSVGDGTIYSDSAYSSIINATTSGLIQLNQPTLGTLVADSTTAITVTFSSVDNRGSYIKLEYKKASDSTWTTDSETIAINAANKQVTGLIENTSYNFRVTVLGNNTVYSDSVVSATSTVSTQSSVNALFYDTFDGTTINTNKWTKTNPNPTAITITQNEKILFNNIAGGTIGADLNMLDSISINNSSLMAFRFDVTRANTNGSNCYIMIVLDASNRIRINTRSSTDPNSTLVIVQGGSNLYINSPTGIAFNGSWKVVKDGNLVNFYRHNGTSWAHIGTEQTINFGSSNFFLRLTMNNVSGGTNESTLDNVYVTDYDYSTLLPV
jgi:hypothetical protein